MPLILGTNSIKDTGYDVANSLRFNDGSSDHLTRTPSSDGNKKIWTWSGWVKRGAISTWQGLFQAGSNNNITDIHFYTDDKLYVRDWNGSSLVMNLITTQVFRDISSFYHILVAIDTTQSTASNRVKIYVNGSQITSFSTETYPSQNLETNFNDTSHQNIIGVAYQIGGSAQYYDGYMAECVFIDGQALDPTSFGEFDEDSPTIWKPKDVSGLTFGTNGFYLDFENSGSLGADVSGNGNNFTVNNLTSVDQSIDTCTNNFCTMNPLSSHGSVTLAEGNTQVNVADNTDNCTSSFMVSSGKWYWEGKYTVGSLAMVGIRPEGMNVYQNNLFNLTGTYQGYYYYADSGNQRPANTSYGASFSTNDIIGFALDLDSGTQTITFYKNGASQGAINIATSGLTWGFSFTSGGGSDTFQMNWGSPAFSISSGNSDANGFGNFEYSVPSGYFSLCSSNLAEFG